MPTADSGTSVHTLIRNYATSGPAIDSKPRRLSASLLFLLPFFSLARLACCFRISNFEFRILHFEFCISNLMFHVSCFMQWMKSTIDNRQSTFNHALLFSFLFILFLLLLFHFLFLFFFLFLLLSYWWSRSGQKSNLKSNP